MVCNKTEAGRLLRYRRMPLPPEDKVKLQVWLTALLGLLVLATLIGGALGVMTKDAVSSIVSGAIGGILGLLTGGNRIVR